MLGSLVPLGPFALARMPIAEWISGATAAVALFALGAYKASLTVGSVVRAGLELAAIGTASALAGWGVGALFGA